MTSTCTIAVLLLTTFHCLLYSVRGHEDPFMPALVSIARLDFDLMADFRPTFANWNTKQIVVMLVLRYTTKKQVRNEVIFWDRIIKRTPF